VHARQVARREVRGDDGDGASSGGHEGAGTDEQQPS
jgi:hypothetical protein